VILRFWFLYSGLLIPAACWLWRMLRGGEGVPGMKKSAQVQLACVVVITALARLNTADIGGPGAMWSGHSIMLEGMLGPINIAFVCWYILLIGKR